MKHLLLAFALAVSAIQPALANDTLANVDQEIATQQNLDAQASRGDDIAGDIIDGIIDGLVSPDRMHRPQRGVMCFAVNRRGQRFGARGWVPNHVQREAMNRCYEWSRHCRPAGCRWVF